jgi:hypothetical protein
MKLNLLPTYVTKGKATRNAAIFSVLLFLGSVGASVAMSWAANDLLQKNKAAEESMRPKAQATVDTYAYAQTIVGSEEVIRVVRNTALAQEMIRHNSKYPNFYNKFIRYIPPFFRLTSIAATPIDDKTSTVTMTGALKSYQQYADLMLILMRYPGAISVGRSGYVSTDPTVPPLSANNQSGTPLKPGETPLPSDPLERLEYLRSQNFSDPGFTGQGNFGTEGTDTRGAAPGYSIVTITVTVNENLQVPNINQTLSASGGGAAAPAGGPGAAGGFPGGRFPGAPGGFPGGPPGAPGGFPGAPGGRPDAGGPGGAPPVD